LHEANDDANKTKAQRLLTDMETFRETMYDETLLHLEEIDFPLSGIVLLDSILMQIVVSDTGVSFYKAIFDNIGKRKATTRKSSGGSGEGFWKVFKLVRMCKASLVIEECGESLEYTKAVIVRFDGKCELVYK
jgi:hypothetical protein